MFGNNPIDEMKRFQAGLPGNPMENSPQGFQARMNMGLNTGPKFEKAVNGNGSYQNIAENTTTGFQQVQQFLNDKFQEDFKPIIPEVKIIKNEFKPIDITPKFKTLKI